MFANRPFRLVFLVASVVLLAVAVGPQSLQPVLASPAPQAGVTLPYAGRLDKATGESVPDSAYDFTFSVYTAQEGGEQLWSETQQGVPVKAGAFNVSLGSITSLPKELLIQDSRWLAVAVRGPGEEVFTDLVPRQILDAGAPRSTAAPQAGLRARMTMWVKPGRRPVAWDSQWRVHCPTAPASPGLLVQARTHGGCMVIVRRARVS